MKKFTDFCNHNDLYELKQGWVIRKPPWMTDMDILHWRFDPITIALAVGGGIQAVSSIQQGRAARQAGETQDAIAQRNALLAERQAEAEQQAAVEAARQQEREGEAFKGRQIAALAKSGVQIARGTPLALVVETAENLEADRLNILREGAISAAQRRGQADILRVQGASAKARGRAASRAATLASVGTILTTVGAVGKSRFDRGRKPFSPGKR
jgi:hypothetical protein